MVAVEGTAELGRHRLRMVLALAAGGCASMGGSSIRRHDAGWWQARFFVRWPPEAEPAWHVDALLAREIVAPALERERAKVALWRFHRRAARDELGHRFSFLFYAAPRTARRLQSGIEESELLRELVRSGLLIEVGYDDTRTVRRPGIGDTSDRNWSPMVKRSWPYFIMGVSEMWLGLIEDSASRLATSSSGASMEERLALYRRVDEEIRATWQTEGRHALLHHLNALFGYGPVRVGADRLMSF